MANTQLFDSRAVGLAPINARNHHGAGAYALQPKHRLAQLAATGCLTQTYYADAQMQVDTMLALCADLDDAYIARSAIYAREKGLMKDMPALLLAILAAQGSDLLPVAFGRVVDNGRMLRNFVQILRSGAVGRRSLGTRPKKLVQRWLNEASVRQLLHAAIGNAPSLADVVKMVHPKPAEPWREALFAWLIGKPFDRAQLPAEVRDLLDWRAVAEGVSDLAHGVDVPDVPFLMLTDRPLVTAQWARLAERMGWQALRMNLNTLARHGVFELPDMADKVARRLADTAAVKAARAYPYQLLAAYRSVDAAVPEVVRQGLQDALDAALANVPVLGGDVVVCPDVSGSMRSPVTGYRAGATTRVRCVDVAGLIAAALLRTHPTARVLPFEQKVVDVRLNPRDSVLTNAEKLAAVGGGGTHCSAPLAWLADKAARVDVVIMVSDNESWVDGRRHGATATMREWARIKRRNPDARLVCIDLQPYGTTQANEQSDILNVGGFGDAVFDVIAQFASGGFGAGHWVEAIESIRIEGT